MSTPASDTDASRKPSDLELSSEDKDRIFEIWKTAVETQKHFNEMSGKSRQLGLTFVAAALGVAVVMLARGDDFELTWFQWKIHVGVLLILAAVFALWAVRRLDLDVYHRMLRGAVTFGEDFEERYMKKIFDLEKGMTQAISHYSRHSDAGVVPCVRGYHYTGGNRVTAEMKIRQFYKHTIIILLASSLALFLITNFSGTPLEGGMDRGRQADSPAPEAGSPERDGH